MKIHRLAILTVATVASLGLGVGPAAAHFCYHNNLTAQAAAGMLKSNGYTSFGALAAEFTGLCPAGVQVLADAAGVTVDTPIHARAVMAGGLGPGSNPAIGHLDFDGHRRGVPGRGSRLHLDGAERRSGVSGRGRTAVTAIRICRAGAACSDIRQRPEQEIAAPAFTEAHEWWARPADRIARVP